MDPPTLLVRLNKSSETQIASCGRCVGPRADVATGMVARPALSVHRRPNTGGGSRTGFSGRGRSPSGGPRNCGALRQTLEGFGGAVVLQAEGNAVSALLPPPSPSGGRSGLTDDAVALRPPEREFAVVAAAGGDEKGAEEAVYADEVGEALALPYCEGLVAPPADRAGFSSGSAASTMAPRVEDVVVGQASVAFVERRKWSTTRAGRALQSGLGGEHPVAMKHGTDLPVRSIRSVSRCSTAITSPSLTFGRRAVLMLTVSRSGGLRLSGSRLALVVHHRRAALFRTGDRAGRGTRRLIRARRKTAQRAPRWGENALQACPWPA